MAVFIVPRGTKSMGWTWVSSSRATAEALHFRELQAELEQEQGVVVEDPADWGYTGPGPRHQYIRVVMREKYGNGTAVMPRFSMHEKAPRAALHRIAQHLTKHGVEWVRFLDGRGESCYLQDIRPAMQRI